jgi:hypothetical protein
MFGSTEFFENKISEYTMRNPVMKKNLGITDVVFELNYFKAKNIIRYDSIEHIFKIL